MKPAFLFFILLQFYSYSLTDAAALTYWSYPSSVTGIQGQNITITFVANLSDHDPGTTWQFVRIMKDGNGAISIKPGEQKVLYGSFVSRSSDLDVNVTQTGVIVTMKVTISNLVKATDEGAYTINPFGTSDFVGGVPTSPVSLTINVSPAKTSPNPSPGTVTVNETQIAQLVCNATGHPAPSINWTRDGVLVGTGSPFTTPVVLYSDDKACYTCVAYNGVLDAKTANVCLNVQYKPRSTLRLVSDKSTVCQNDKVNLTCTSGPANPAPSSYEFYDDGVLIGTSASNVYEATATEGLPAVNSFVCVPRNLLGSALENGSVEVSAKVAPRIVTSPQATTVVEGSALTLFCNASGTPAPNITWTKVGGSNVGNIETYTIISVTRGDEGTYRCTATNSGECSNVTADANIVVNYRPKATTLTSLKSNLNDSVTLQCTTDANPPAYEYRFYLNDALVHTSMSGVYQFNVPQAGNNTYKCEPKNTVGAGQNATMIITKDSYVAPNFNNITITEASVTVTWSMRNLLSPLKTMVTCWFNIIESTRGSRWMTSSNTSYGSSISCSFSGLQHATLYHIQYAISNQKNYVNGTIYVATPAKGVIGSSHPNRNTGVSSTAFIAVIVVAIAIIVFLILVIIWMRFQDRQKNKRTNSKEKCKTEVQLQTFETLYENDGFISRGTKADRDLALYEQVQNRGLARNQGVDRAPSIPMGNVPRNPERFERKGWTTAAENQAQSRDEDPSYQSVDLRKIEAGKRVDDIEDSYGHLMDFTRRPGHNTTLSSEDQSHYQELQPENGSKHYHSLQNLQRPAFSI